MRSTEARTSDMMTSSLFPTSTLCAVRHCACKCLQVVDVLAKRKLTILDANHPFRHAPAPFNFRECVLSVLTILLSILMVISLQNTRGCSTSPVQPYPRPRRQDDLRNPSPEGHHHPRWRDVFEHLQGALGRGRIRMEARALALVTSRDDNGGEDPWRVL